MKKIPKNTVITNNIIRNSIPKNLFRVRIYKRAIINNYVQENFRKLCIKNNKNCLKLIIQLKINNTDKNYRNRHNKLKNSILIINSGK